MKTAIAAALLSLSTLAAVPAQAAPGWIPPHAGTMHEAHRLHRDRLSTSDVRLMLRDAGYRHIRIVDDRGAVYQVHARKNGHPVFLMVSARTGEILARNLT